MSKMSSLHAESADERACALANDVDYLEKCIEELSEALRPFVEYGSAFESYYMKGMGLPDDETIVWGCGTAYGPKAKIRLGDFRTAAKDLEMFGHADKLKPKPPEPPADPWPFVEF